MPPFPLIDAHQDLAYNALTHGRDYRLAAHQTRAVEAGSPVIERTGDCLLGWPDFQRGQVALIFGTLFLSPPSHSADWENQVARTPDQARALWQGQVDVYRRMCDDNPEMFRPVVARGDLNAVLQPWLDGPAAYDAQPPSTHPTGLLLLMEGAEAIGRPRDLEEWWQAGVRIVGPVWAGERFCGGTLNPGGSFSREGYELLEVMTSLGLALDLSHMNEKSALQALDRYEGVVLATHANARVLLRQNENERHLTDLTIRRLVERGGVMGVLPFAKFIRAGWAASDDPRLTSLETVAAHIDHICQLAGDASHVGIGTDFDGGFGWPHVPYEVDTIADLQKLALTLAARGYAESDIAAIFASNWRSLLKRILPA